MNEHEKAIWAAVIIAGGGIIAALVGREVKVSIDTRNMNVGTVAATSFANESQIMPAVTDSDPTTIPEHDGIEDEASATRELTVVEGTAVRPSVPDSRLGRDGFATVTDDSNTIEIDVPAEWTDLDGSAWFFEDEEVGVSITAASDRDAFVNSYLEPGVFVGVSHSLALRYDPVSLMDRLKVRDLGVSRCTSRERTPFNPHGRTGVIEVFEKCGEEEGVILAAVYEIPNDEYTVCILLQARPNLVTAFFEMVESLEVKSSLESTAIR